VVNGLLARGRSLEQPDRVVWGVNIVQRGVGLSAILYDGFHYIHSSHSCGSVQLLDLLAVGVLQEVVQVVLGRRLVRIPHVGVLV